MGTVPPTRTTFGSGANGYATRGAFPTNGDFKTATNGSVPQSTFPAAREPPQPTYIPQTKNQSYPHQAYSCQMHPPQSNRWGQGSYAQGNAYGGTSGNRNTKL